VEGGPFVGRQRFLAGLQIDCSASASCSRACPTNHSLNLSLTCAVPSFCIPLPQPLFCPPSLLCLQLAMGHDDGEVLRSATAYLRTLLQVRGTAAAALCALPCWY
jgi:hypothetical protein